MMTLGLFAFFVLTRAIHPTIIDESKTVLESGKRGFAYSNLSCVIVQNIIVIICFQLVTVASGGIAQWRSIWSNTAAFKVFGMNGAILAVGDWLEMASMGKLSGAAYQVLLQSKFVITALMMMYVKGSKQTRLQWVLLVSLMLSMSLYMCIGKGSGGGAPLIGMTFAFLKVVVSCYGAVLSDKYTKDFKDVPTHVCVVQMGVPRLICTLLLSFTQPADWQRGLFHGWDIITVGVAVSFIVKVVSTLYFVALLDSLLKNIGEALAVIVIYFWETFPVIMDPEKSFDMTSFLAVVVIVLTVGAYLDAKTVVDKANKFDASQKK